MARKWIVEDNSFRMASAIEFHSELATVRKNVKGGGYWHMDHQDKKLYLYGQSEDFGQCDEEDVRAAIENYAIRRLDGWKVYFSKHMSLSDNMGNSVFISEIM